MKDYLDGWIKQIDVDIPEIERKGFQQNVIIRENIAPKRKMNVFKKLKESEEDDDPTVLVDDEATMFKEFVAPSLFLKRMKTGGIIKIEQEEFVIGKRNDSDYIIRDNPTISRKHACIYLEEGDFWLKDLNSSNHVYIGWKKISEPVKLKPGILFRLSTDEKFKVMDTMSKK